MVERINTVNNYLKEHFGKKTVKLSIDAGFTCPNRDGSKGTGGCVFCSSTGSGDTATDIEDQMRLLSDKWPNANYLAYFQNHSNTYAPAEELRKKYYEALAHPDISGIVIATRPDCFTPEILDLLEEINNEHFMWIEMGLQTIHDKTMKDMNLCYNLKDYEEAMNQLKKRNIKVVTHLILGLPGETREMMEESLKYVCNGSTWGIKLHLLNVVKGSPMEKIYPGYQSFENIDDYINLVTDFIEMIPKDIVVHRMTADVPRKLLLSPPWSYKKRTILNGINKNLRERNTYQGYNSCLEK